MTVRLPAVIVPHPLPGLSFTVFCRKGVGGVRPNQRAEKARGKSVLTLDPKNTMAIINLQGREMSSLPAPTYSYINRMHAQGQTRKQTDRLTDREGSENHTKTPTRAAKKKKKKKKTQGGAGTLVKERSTEYGSNL